MTNFKGQSFTFIGKSGSGKGTQVDLFEKKLRSDGYAVLRHTTGDVFRELAQKDTVGGRMVQEIIGVGGFLPGWFSSYTWLKNIIENLKDIDTVVLFDGSPRTIEETMRFDEAFVWFRMKRVVPIYIDVSVEEVVRRLMLRGRFDDTEAIIYERLKSFDKEVMPIVDYYKNQQRLITVHGAGTVEEVFERIVNVLEFGKMTTELEQKP